MKDEKVIRSKKQEFTEGESCLTRLFAFYEKITGLVDEGRTADIVYLEFSKVFDSISLMILIEELMM